MRRFLLLMLATIIAVITACNSENRKMKTQDSILTHPAEFNYFVEQFADLRIMRYYVPGFEDLTSEQKKLVYYLSEAALCGRDIIFDQNYKHNLRIRKTLEEIYKHYNGDRSSEDFREFEIYLKRVWFANGIHHHNSTDKFVPGFSREGFINMIQNSPGGSFPLHEGQELSALALELTGIIFDPDIAPKRISLDPTKDLIKNSACNFYDGVTQKEAEDFYEAMKIPGDQTPVSHGLNSKLVRENGQIIEQIYKIEGLYGEAIEKIVYWLEKAAQVAENEQQRAVIKKLVDFYKTGDLHTFDQFNILWVHDLESRVDFVNGFTEVYGDPLGMKATWESVVNFTDLEATKRAEAISDHAQWFEDHSPVDERFRKKDVKGVSAKVITVAQLGGDCYPATPIGINLPNAYWIRKEHGSKSVTMENIMYSYHQVSLNNGFVEEFAATEEEAALSKKYGFLGGNLHTDLHECLGHGSGQLLPETGPEALRNYASALEEARADLFALYYMMDDKMLELGLMPTLDVARAEYDRYIRNGLMTQLTRVEQGKNIEQAHMRNRQLIAQWCYEKGEADNVIEKFERNDKTYFKINDYQKLRGLFGELLAEVQRIKSEGDFEAGKRLVEDYGVQVDRELHAEVLERFRKLNIAPFSGFVNPVLRPVVNEDVIIDVKVDYSEDYTSQMLRYSEEYSFLPVISSN